MRTNFGAVALAAALLAAPLGAQTAPRTLSLDEALSLARRNSPTWRSVEND